MFLKYKCLIILLLFLTGNMMTEAQELIAPTDTVMAVVAIRSYLPDKIVCLR